MTREADLLQSLVEMADTLVDDFDVVELLTGLAERCVALLDVAAAGVMLVSPRGELRLVGSSSEAMRVVEMFELQAQEGPCLDAFHTGKLVGREHLDIDGGRWPRFTMVALEAGFTSAVAVPLRLRDQTIGALNLFSTGPIPMTDENVHVARAFADLATISVLQHQVSAEIQTVNGQLAHALSSRILVEQAKGVIFERAGVSMEEAFSRLRGYARSRDLLLSDVAQSAIEGSLDPDVWA